MSKQVSKPQLPLDTKLKLIAIRKLFNGTHEPKIGLFFKVEEYLKNKEV